MSLEAYRNLGYAGLGLWGVMLLEFVFLKIVGRYVLKKPVFIPAEVGEEGKEAFLAQRRESLEKVIKRINRVSWGIGISIMLSSLGILVSSVLGAVVNKSFILKSLILTSVLLPAYFGNLTLVSFFKNLLRQLENNEQIINKPKERPAAAAFLPLVNLLPPLATLALLYLVPWPELPVRLGFGLGVMIVMALLAVVFIRAGAAVGVFVNLILLNFVFASYLLPGFDGVKGSPPESAAVFVTVTLLTLLGAGSAGFLVSWALAKRRGVFFSSQHDRLFQAYSRVPFRFCFLGAFGALLAKSSKILCFSTAFVFLQALAWLILLATLLAKEFRGKVDFREVRDYIIKEKGLKINLGSATLLANLALFLAVGAFFESYRGMWPLWAGANLWLLLMLISLWKVWRYAFEES